MKRIHFVKLLLVAVLFVADVVPIWGYTIAFKSSTTGSDGSTAQSTISNVVSEGSSYLSTISCTKIYNGKSGYGIKLGTGSATGNITLNFSSEGQIKPTKITIKACRYGSDTGNLNYKINGGTQSSKTLTTTLADYEITMDGNTTLTSLYLASSAKRIYIVSIEVESGSGETTVSFTPSSIDFGTVTVGDTKSEKVSVAISNPTSNISLSISGNGLSVSPNSLSKTGDVTITYAPTSAGTLSGTLTATGGGLKTDVTAAITATAQAPTTSYTVTWVVGSNSSKTQSYTTQVADGSKATPPAELTFTGSEIGDCVDTFVGWSKSILKSPTNTPPSDLFKDESPDKITSDNVTFYAVFAKKQTN